MQRHIKTPGQAATWTERKSSPSNLKTIIDPQQPQAKRRLLTLWPSCPPAEIEDRAALLRQADVAARRIGDWDSWSPVGPTIGLTQIWAQRAALGPGIERVDAQLTRQAVEHLLIGTAYLIHLGRTYGHA